MDELGQEGQPSLISTMVDHIPHHQQLIKTLETSSKPIVLGLVRPLLTSITDDTTSIVLTLRSAAHLTVSTIDPKLTSRHLRSLLEWISIFCSPK